MLRLLARAIAQHNSIRSLEHQLGSRLRTWGLARSVHVTQATEAGWPRYRVKMIKKLPALHLTFDYRGALGDGLRLGIFADRLPAAIHPFLRTNVGEAHADISDGEENDPSLIAFSARVPDSLLIPDSDFQATGGYVDVRRQTQADAVPWQQRSAAIVWRGSTTGYGVVAPEDMRADYPGLLPRTRMCLLLKGMDDVDARFVQVLQVDRPSLARQRLQEAGIIGERISVSAWGSRKFALDIDGNANAWSNLFTRLLLGCCVIKVASPAGYRQWYYDDLRAWEHFVPVASDVSDLVEKIEWCRANDAACSEIAASGRRFAMARTYETEMSHAAERIKLRLART